MTGAVHPMALRLLARLNYRTDGLRSKSWDEFRRGQRQAARLRLHGLRPSRRRGVPRLAGPADNGSLGVEDPAAFSGTDEQTHKLFRTAG